MERCPPFHHFLLPMLERAAGGEVNVRTSADDIANSFGLTERALAETVKSGKQFCYIDRTHWAATYLRQAQLIETTRRGFVKITDEGVSFLASYKADDTERIITVSELARIPAFAAFIGGKQTRADEKAGPVTSSEDEVTPPERIARALEEIDKGLAESLLGYLKKLEPAEFEQTVLDMLKGMGYGGSQKHSAHRLGQSGDDGVDGLIVQDPLGLDRVFVQAKRYKSDNVVSAEAVRGFAGALALQQANKGLFVTTSSFSKSARQTAEKLPQRIVLIDGEFMARLMISYNVGCSIRESFHIKQIDNDYFAETSLCL